MKTKILFERVSKRYNLGVSRTSLPNVLSHFIRRSLNRDFETSFKKNNLWALKDVSFELKEGESLALIGPNGAGKTTILKLLANITKPTSGRIETNGKLSALIELGAGFHPDLTGYENIYLNGTILGLKRKEIEKHFDEILAFSELEYFIDTPLKRYSSGMKVRLGFAVASCINPDILLVDEVLAVGDAAFRQKCINRIHELINQGTSIIFISHNLWLVQTVCTSAIYIEKGQVLFSGQTQEAVNLYDQSLSKKRAKMLEISRVETTNSDSEIEISDIKVVGLDGLEKNELLNDEMAEIRIHYVAYRSFGDVNIVVRIIRSDGVTCCMMRSNLDNVRVSVEGGAGVVSVILDPLQLRGGLFYVQAMVRDASDLQGISSKNSDWFAVAGSVLSNNDMNGVFEPRRRWQHRTVLHTINEIQLEHSE